MQRHHILGALTTLASLPLFLVAALLVLLQAPISHWLVLESVFLALGALAAGVLLWGRHRFMYWAGTVVWGLLVIWSLSSLIALSAASWMTAYLLVGIPVCAYLVRELRRTRIAS